MSEPVLPANMLHTSPSLKYEPFSLPFELLYAIFYHLKPKQTYRALMMRSDEIMYHKRNLASASLVCKNWSVLARAFLFQTLCIP